MDNVKELKLIYVVNNPAFFLSHRLQLAIRAKECGFRVIVFAPKSPEISEISRLGFEIEELKLNRKNINPLGELRTLFDLFLKFKKWKPSIVHGISTKPVIYTSIVGYLCNVPNFVQTITGLGYSFTRGGFAGLLLRSIVGLLYKISFYRKNIKVVFQNHDDCRYFIENKWISPEKSEVVRGSGVDLSKYTVTEIPDGVPQILFPSRLLSDKGLYELVNACRVLHSEGIEFKLVLSGPIDENSRAGVTESQIRKWESLGYIKWIGNQTNMVPIYRMSHIICLPSYREGLSLSLLEAAASGRPIVTTDVPGCRDIVENGRSGFVVPAKEVKPLAEALRVLIKDSELRISMGKRGRQLVMNEFSLDSVVEKTITYYPGLKPTFPKSA